MVDFSDSGSTIIERAVEISEDLIVEEELLVNADNIKDIFELERCLNWIEKNNLKQVGLQFPDYLLKFAPKVAKGLEEKLNREVFILGDTSYGECCVDEVAAEHLNADGIIHFGHTCLTPSQKLPVLYVFTVRPFDVEKLKSSIRGKFDIEDSLLIIYDVEYHHALHNFHMTDWKGRVIVGSPVDSNTSIPDGSVKKFGRLFQVSSFEELKSSKVVYVSTEDKDSLKLNNFMFSFCGNDFFVYNREGLNLATKSVQKLLMKRYFLIEKTKDAERIGILVGTLGVANFNDVIARLRELIKKSGKKSYTFLVGKLNPHKLANFPEVEVFVLVACPETSFPDSSDFFQSVVTPYELEVALNGSREWGAQYFTDFRDLLPGGDGYVEDTSSKDDNEDNSPDISLVTGRVRTAGQGTVGEGEGELMVINDRTVSQLHARGGGEYLASRSWSGLEQKLGETSIEPLVHGKTGIAQGYQGEGES